MNNIKTIITFFIAATLASCSTSKQNPSTSNNGTSPLEKSESVYTVNGEEKLNLLMVDDAIPAGAKLC